MAEETGDDGDVKRCIRQQVAGLLNIWYIAIVAVMDVLVPHLLCTFCRLKRSKAKLYLNADEHLY